MSMPEYIKPQLQGIQKRLFDEIVDGLGLYGMEKGVDYLRKALYTSIERNLKQYSKGAIMVGISLVDLAFPQVKRIPYVGDWLDIVGRVGVKEIVRQAVDKPPYCVATDANTIHCYNFESTSVSVAIDGKELTSGTDFTVSGTAEDMTINLTNALSSGEHDLRVADTKKSWYGKIKV